MTQRNTGFGQRRKAINVLAAVLASDWPGSGVEADGSGCYCRGFSNLSKQLSDSPPSVPGVVDVDSEWALEGVSSAQAKAALRRARGELARQGWKVTSYEESKFRNELSTRPPGTDDTVTVEAYPGDRLMVRAYAECARYPSGTPMGAYGDPELPSQQAPLQLRR
ncbi:hypothetical protein ACFZDJ_32620 [Streptomyces sp. NPDC007896]|uniref:hypothetical protein n=1 Tax=Streptomyces sp. NPDC007896 TaxID=3364784 RepID=UPI0036EAC183